MKYEHQSEQTDMGQKRSRHTTTAANNSNNEAELARSKRRTEERYRIFTSISTQIFWFTNADGLMNEDNPLWRAYTGQSMSEILERGWMDAIHPDDLKLFMIASSRAFDDKRFYEVKFRLQRFDGIYHTFLARGIPSIDEHGNIEEWINVCNDTTERKKLEEAQREFEWYLRTTFEQATIGMMYLGLDGKIRRVNRWLCDRLGYEHENFQQSYLQDLSFQDDPNDDFAYIRSASKEKLPPFAQEKRFHCKDSSVAWVFLTITPVYKPSGTLSHFTAFVQDIEQRKELQEQLQKSVREAQTRASYLEAIFESMIDNVFIYDTSGNVMRLNNAVREFAPDGSIPEGYNERAMGERTATYAVRDEHGHLLAEDELPMKRILRGEVLKGAKAVDIIFRQPDGQDMQVSMTGTPIRNREGQIVGALCISRDVTERRTLERRTREALDALVAMAETLVKTPPSVEASETSLLLSSATHQVIQRIVELTCRMLGCYRVTMLTINTELPMIYPMASVGFSREQEARWFTLTAGGRSSQFTDLLLDPNIHACLQANEILLLDMSQPSFAPISTILNIHAILLAPVCIDNRLVAVLYADYGVTEHKHTTDETSLIGAMSKLSTLAIERERQAVVLAKMVSTLQKTNEQLEQVNKLQSDFITMVSHEFRTTLTSIQGFSELLRDEDFSALEVKEYADDINGDAKRLTRMISELLDLERMKLGKMTLHLEAVDVNDLLKGTSERTNLTAHHHTLKLQLDDTLPPIEGDPDKLIQVIANLVTNAIKYSPTGGAILLTSALEDKHIHLTVRDYGIGIPEDALEQIFVPYSRVEAGATRYIEGTGLGLPIVRQIVQMHGGRAWAESQHGHGSTFHIVLPIKQTHTISPTTIKN